MKTDPCPIFICAWRSYCSRLMWWELPQLAVMGPRPNAFSCFGERRKAAELFTRIICGPSVLEVFVRPDLLQVSVIDAGLFEGGHVPDHCFCCGDEFKCGRASAALTETHIKREHR